MQLTTPRIAEAIQALYDNAKNTRDRALAMADQAEQDFQVASRLHDLLLEDTRQPASHLRSVS